METEISSLICPYNNNSPRADGTRSRLPRCDASGGVGSGVVGSRLGVSLPQANAVMIAIGAVWNLSAFRTRIASRLSDSSPPQVRIIL
ncbi:MAG: hypothetical protein AAFQ77_01670 [Myxococcota bacterium]